MIQKPEPTHSDYVVSLHFVCVCRPPIDQYQIPLSSLLGQPAFSNSTFRQTDLRAALHRLQATKAKLRHKLKPHHQAGQGVVKLLQVCNPAVAEVTACAC